MEHKIVKLEKMTVIGLSTLYTMKHNLIPNLWNHFVPRAREVKHVINPNVMLGISYQMDKIEGEYESFYIAGLIVDKAQDIPEGMTYLILEKQEYAKFTHIGSLETLQNTYNYIYDKWLPNSDYKVETGNELEWYDERFKHNSTDSMFDIFIPIKKK